MKQRSFSTTRIFVVIFILFVAGACLSIYHITKETSNKVFVKSEKNAQLTNIEKHFQEKSPFNLLLLGYGGGNHDGAYLTDTIILSRVNPKNKTITLLSVPRDTWVTLPTNGNDTTEWKINAAYQIGLDDEDYPSKLDIYKGEIGAGNLAKYGVAEITGLTPDYFVAGDFNGFRNTINTLGGIDVPVDITFDDYEYPIEGKENDLCGKTETDLPELEKIATVSALDAFPCRYQHIHFDKGLQHMDGEEALEYARSRHSLQDGTDFGRSQRQHNVLVAVKKKVFSIGFLPKALPFLLSLGNDVRTDMDLEDIKSLIEHANELNRYTIHNLALTNENFLEDAISPDGQAILVPSNKEGNFDQIHTWLKNILSRQVIGASPIIQVENGTYIAGLAQLATNRLRDKDFNVLEPTTNEDGPTAATSITVFSKNIDPKVIADLEKEFGVKKVSKQLSTQHPYDIVIKLGADYNEAQGKKYLN